MEFNERLYAAGFEAAMIEIRDEGLEYAERKADNLSGSTKNVLLWSVVGYRTCVDAYKEGANL